MHFGWNLNHPSYKVISNHFLKSTTLTQDEQTVFTRPVLESQFVDQLVSQKETLEADIVLTLNNQVETAYQPIRLNVPFELETVPVQVPVPVPVSVQVPIPIPIPVTVPVTEYLFEDIFPGIDGYGFILMGNQEYKQIYNLNKGDIVMSFDQNNIMIPSKIKYIVKTKINNLIMMSYMNNVAISSNHKIQINNSDWFYPKYFLNTHKSKIDYLYNIILENGCGVIVNNLKVITLGYLNNYNRDISYYATQAYVNDIANYDINNDGYIVLENLYI